MRAESQSRTPMAGKPLTDALASAWPFARCQSTLVESCQRCSDASSAPGVRLRAPGGAAAAKIAAAPLALVRAAQQSTALELS